MKKKATENIGKLFPVRNNTGLDKEFFKAYWVKELNTPVNILFLCMVNLDPGQFPCST